MVLLMDYDRPASDRALQNACERVAIPARWTVVDAGQALVPVQLAQPSGQAMPGAGTREMLSGIKPA